MKIYIVTLSIIFAFLLISCKDTQNAYDTINTFYSFRQKQQNQSIATLLSPKFIEATSAKDFAEMLNNIDKNYGKLTSHSFQMYNVKTLSGIEIATFKFKAFYPKATLIDSLVLIKEDNTFKLLYYQYRLEPKK